MVEFLENIEGKDFLFKKGKRYVSMESPTKELKDSVLVRQPNSPKKRNLWSSFSSKCVGREFKIVDGTFKEKIEEERLLQL